MSRQVLRVLALDQLHKSDHHGHEAAVEMVLNSCVLSAEEQALRKAWTKSSERNTPIIPVPIYNLTKYLIDIVDLIEKLDRERLL